MSHAKVIVNPCARGGVTGKMWPRISQLLTGGLSFDCEFTQGMGHATELARQAVAKGYELVVAVGGDGTANEVVNGLVDEGGRGRATLGIISSGTGGDVVRTLGIPRDHARACRLLVEPAKRVIDLGVVEYMGTEQRVRRLFINTAGLGFDAAVVERLRGSFLRRMKGTFPYVVSVVLTLGGYGNKPVTLDVDGRRGEGRIFSIVVNNGRYFGGGMKIAPDADPGDGLLDVVVIGDVGKLEVLSTFPKVYRGTHVTHPKVMACQAKSIQVESAERLLLQVDGELVGEAPARFEVLPAALTVAR